MPWRELAFISWAGLRGAVPIVLATIPLSEGVDGAERLFDIVFVLVVLYTLLTGPTLPLGRQVAAGRAPLRAARPRRRGRAAGAGRGRPAAGHDQPGSSRMHGVEVGELRLPPGASVSMVVRDDETLVPERRTVLRHGDEAGRGHAAPAAPSAPRSGCARSAVHGRLGRWWSQGRALARLAGRRAADDGVLARLDGRSRPSASSANSSPTTTVTPAAVPVGWSTTLDAGDARG